MHAAQSSRDIRIIKELLRHPNIEVNSVTRTGETAVWLAVSYVQYDAINTLLEDERININAENNKGEIALYCALDMVIRCNSDRCLSIAHRLIEAGAHDERSLEIAQAQVAIKPQWQAVVDKIQDAAVS